MDISPHAPNAALMVGAVAGPDDARLVDGHVGRVRNGDVPHLFTEHQIPDLAPLDDPAA